MCMMFYTPHFPFHFDQFIFSSHWDVQSNRHPVRETKRINAASNPMNGTEVAVHIVSEQDDAPRMRDDASCSTSDEQMHGNPNGLTFDENVERCA